MDEQVFYLKILVSFFQKKSSNNNSSNIKLHFLFQAGIRTNTTICLGKIAQYLSEQVYF